MKQVFYSGKYSLSANRAHGILSVHAFYMCRYLIIVEKACQLQKRIVDETDELY